LHGKGQKVLLHLRLFARYGSEHDGIFHTQKRRTRGLFRNLIDIENFGIAIYFNFTLH